MPRNGSGVYSLPSTYLATTGETITALQHNAPLLDLEADANAARSVATGGTGASTAAGARDNLGVTIGSDVQAFSTKLTAVAALAVTDGGFIVGNGTTFVLETGATALTSLGVSDFIQTLLDDEDAAAARSTLGVNSAVTLTAGDGLTGGGSLDQNRTVDLGTPGSLNSSSTNAATASSHTHQVDFGDGAAALAVGEIGTYAMLSRVAGTSAVAPGDVVGGSTLRYSNADATTVSGTPSGSWECMGRSSAVVTGQGSPTLWKRVS